MSDDEKSVSIGEEIPSDALVLDSIRIVRYMSNESDGPLIHIAISENTGIYDMMAMQSFLQSSIFGIANGCLGGDDDDE